MYRVFIETELFTELIDEQGGQKLLEIVQHSVLLDICRPASKRQVIQGSGGFTKVRVKNPYSNKGKSAGHRVIYFDLPTIEITFLFLIYPKSIKENITQKQIAELKKASTELKSWQPRKRKK